MKKIMAYYIACTLIIFFGCAGPVAQKTTRQNALQRALELAASDEVFQLQVFYYPEDALVEGKIDEMSLENSAWGKVSLLPFQVCKLRTRLIARLRKTSLTPCDKVSGDYRWGCIFYNNRGNRLVSLYLTRDGYGSVNGLCVKTDDGLLDLLRHEFSWLVDSW